MTNFNSQCFQLFSSSHRVLSSAEVLSTDEESSDSGGESDDELGRNLESLLSSKKTAMELTHEQEEIERQELRYLLLECVYMFVCLSIFYQFVCLLHQIALFLTATMVLPLLHVSVSLNLLCFLP